jgi:uncharacterized ion transporter superfamily protein YfcC
MDEKAGAQISKKAFIQSFLILFLLVMVAGILTRVVPTGTFARVDPANSSSAIIPGSFKLTSQAPLAIWHWFTAPVEVLWKAGGESLKLISIILFILLVSSSFAVLDKSGILRSLLGKIVTKFGGRKYVLLLALSFFFMLLGAFFGIFEEVVPLVPLMIALAYSLGWDAMVGLGMSILATNMGFSAAISNPFTIGVAQSLANLPMFSGWAFRIPIFIAFYLLLAWFLLAYARKIDRKPEASLTFADDQASRARYKNVAFESNPNLARAGLFFVSFIVLIVLVLVGTKFSEFLASYSFVLAGLLFFIGGLGAGFLSGAKGKLIGKALLDGISGMAPAIPLMLMAYSVKYLVTLGGVMDTILNSASGLLQGVSPLAAILIIFGLALFFEIFIGSGSAKAFLLMPILVPLADLVGVTRQLTVTAYCFGDGFSNMAYPTNAVLLIAIGMASVGYGKWMKFTWKLWALVIPLVVFFLWLGIKIGYGLP